MRQVPVLSQQSSHWRKVEKVIGLFVAGVGLLIVLTRRQELKMGLGCLLLGISFVIRAPRVPGRSLGERFRQPRVLVRFGLVLVSLAMLAADMIHNFHSPQ